LLYLAVGDVGADERSVSYLDSLMIVALAAFTAWAAYAAREHIGRQPPALIEQLPPQPGDTAPAVGAAADSRGGSAAVVPSELLALREAVAEGVRSRRAYHDVLEPVLREAAIARADRKHREVDVDAIVDLDRHLPAVDDRRSILVRVSPFRRKAIRRAVAAIVTNIEEI
jgi:hypothetical protein